MSPGEGDAKQLKQLQLCHLATNYSPRRVYGVSGILFGGALDDGLWPWVALWVAKVYNMANNERTNEAKVKTWQSVIGLT